MALAYLDDPSALVEAAASISALTHADPEAGDACALWCLAIRRAVLDGTFDVRAEPSEHLPPERAAMWAERIREPEQHQPAHFTHNGWVVQALQGAWSAIHHTMPGSDLTSSEPPARHLSAALEAAVPGGRDTYTVAAIAGALLGARWGASAVPWAWRRRLHGWPGLWARDLVRLGVLTARRGSSDTQGWPAGSRMDYSSWPDRSVVVQHPHDEDVWLSGIDGLTTLPEGVDAVVSLCRLGTEDIPGVAVQVGDHIEVWLVDDEHPDSNPHLDFVLREAADAVAALRAEGKAVLIHCVQAQSRTPTVGALYGSLVTGKPPRACLSDIQRVLPSARPNPAMLAALDRL